MSGAEMSVYAWAILHGAGEVVVDASVYEDLFFERLRRIV